MKTPQPSKRKLVIVEARKLALDFYFDAPNDGQKIKKMRMLDTSAKTKMLTHIVSTKDTLLDNKVNLTIHHRDSLLLNNSLAHRAENEQDVIVEGPVEANVAHGDPEIDVGGVEEGGQQMEATSKTDRNKLTQSVATLKVANDGQRENGKVKEPTSSTKEQSKSLSNPTQAAHSTTEPAVKEPMPARKTKAAILSERLAPIHQCHLCATPPTKYLEMLLHYASAHGITIPRSAKYPHLLPDPNNADYYCQMCDKKLKNPYSFKSHMERLHKISPESSTKQSNNGKNASASNEAAAEASAMHNNASNFAIKFSYKDGQMNRLISSSPSSPTSEPTTPPPPPSSQQQQQQELPASVPSSATVPQPTLVACYPNYLDPNNYCRCCDKTFSDKKYFRQHCRSQHVIPDPDENDPNFFCDVCDLKYPDLFTYRQHLGKVHLMKGFPEMVDITCYHCKRIYPDGKKYDAHLKKVTKRIAEKEAEKQEELQAMEDRPMPLWNDPNFHCTKCLRTFSKDLTYKSHLRTVHNMTAKHHKNPPKGQQESSQSNGAVDGANVKKDHFFCFACRKDFFDRKEFDQHLKQTHKLSLTKGSIDNLQIAPSPPVFAKPLDPTLYYFMMRDIGQAHSP